MHSNNNNTGIERNVNYPKPSGYSECYYERSGYFLTRPRIIQICEDHLNKSITKEEKRFGGNWTERIKTRGKISGRRPRRRMKWRIMATGYQKKSELLDIRIRCNNTKFVENYIIYDETSFPRNDLKV